MQRKFNFPLIIIFIFFIIQADIIAQNSEFYPFIPQNLSDSRLNLDYQKFSKRKLLVFIPLLNENEGKQFNWLQNALGKTLVRKLQILEKIPNHQPLLLSNIVEKEILLGKKKYKIIDILRYQNQDRRNSLKKIRQLEIEKKNKNNINPLTGMNFLFPEKSDDLILEEALFSILYLQDWQELVYDYLKRSSVAAELSLIGPPGNLFSKMRQSENIQQMSWQEIFNIVTKYLWSELKRNPGEINAEVLILGGSFYTPSLDSPEKKASSLERREKYWQQALTGHKNNEEIMLRLFLFDTKVGKIIWEMDQKLNIKGNWLPLIETADRVRDFFFNIRNSMDLYNVPPGFRIYIDKQYYGKTPSQINSIPEGLHKLELVKDEYEKEEIWFKLKAGESIEVHSNPQKAFYNTMISIKGTNGARVYINGKPYGSIPLKVKSVRPGFHRIRVEAQSFHAKEIALKINKFEKKDITLNLKSKELFFEEKELKEKEIKKPYRGLKIFQTGNIYERSSKYFLALSTLTFASAIISNGYGKRKVDSFYEPQKNSVNPYAGATNVFIGIGISSLLASGILLYLSFLSDDELFSKVDLKETNIDNFHFFQMETGIGAERWENKNLNSPLDFKINFVIGVRY